MFHEKIGSSDSCLTLGRHLPGRAASWMPCGREASSGGCGVGPTVDPCFIKTHKV